MPTAGFFVSHVSRIRFGKDGEWYADDERITNRRIASLFSRCLRREADGRYAIRMADEHAVVEIEDTPFVITGVSRESAGTLAISLNDETSETLDPETLRVGRDNVLYARVKGGAEEARFLRPAYYQIAAFLSEPQPGRFVLELGGAVYVVAGGSHRD